MSVYTLLTAVDIQSFLDQYALPPLGGFAPIKSGIENSNYFVTLVDGRELVLTLFEELPAAEAGVLGPMLSHLEACGVPVATPLRNDAGLFLGLLLGKPAQLAPRLPGSHPSQPDRRQCAAMGEALAHLHIALQGYPLERANAHGAAWWDAVARRWQGQLPPPERTLLQRILQLYADTCARHPELPGGLIHGDLFRDNTLFMDDTVTAVLDFSETSHDHWLLDIAITVNDFCRVWPTTEPDPVRRAAFLDGYEHARPLLDAEKAALPVFLAVAAMRFWLSRLDIGERNRAENRGGEHVLEKDPAEMQLLASQLLGQIAGD
ncbi:MAG: homoserine kinase [Moraxellaceae bacterium]|jgi:homoserine kinase type II|nr:homoserine kinase [Moraxellaceae bacterium]